MSNTLLQKSQIFCDTESTWKILIQVPTTYFLTMKIKLKLNKQYK